jgi:hypothetical protein
MSFLSDGSSARCASFAKRSAVRRATTGSGRTSASIMAATPSSPTGGATYRATERTASGAVGIAAP